MRLAFVGPAPPYRGGISQFNHRLAKACAKDHDILLINFTRLYPDFLFPGRTQYEISNDKHTHDRAEPPRPVIDSERILDSLNPLSWRRTGRAVREWQADAIIFQWWHPFFTPAYLGVRSANRRVASMAVCHNVLPHESNPAINFLGRRFLRKVDGAVVHSARERSDFEQISRSPVKELFHPIYDQFPGSELDQAEARRRLSIDEGAQVVLNFGLVRHYKGVDILLRAASLLTDLPKLKIYICGEIYSGGGEIRRLAEAAPRGMVSLNDNFISGDEVAVWFRAADVVVLPYRSATQSGIIPIAYHCLRPVIATRVGGLPDVVEEGETGFLVPSEDPAALARQIRSFFDDESGRDFTPGIRRMVNRLSWEAYQVELTAFLNSLMTGRG